MILFNTITLSDQHSSTVGPQTLQETRLMISLIYPMKKHNRKISRRDQRTPNYVGVEGLSGQSPYLPCTHGNRFLSQFKPMSQMGKDQIYVRQSVDMAANMNQLRLRLYQIDETLIDKAPIQKVYDRFQRVKMVDSRVEDINRGVLYSQKFQKVSFSRSNYDFKDKNRSRAREGVLDLKRNYQRRDKRTRIRSVQSYYKMRKYQEWVSHSSQSHGLSEKSLRLKKSVKTGQQSVVLNVQEALVGKPPKPKLRALNIKKIKPFQTDIDFKQQDCPSPLDIQRPSHRHALRDQLVSEPDSPQQSYCTSIDSYPHNKIEIRERGDGSEFNCYLLEQRIKEKDCQKSSSGSGNSDFFRVSRDSTFRSKRLNNQPFFCKMDNPRGFGDDSIRSSI